MKEILGYIGSGKSTYLSKLKTKDIKHVDINFRKRLPFVVLFIIGKPLKLRYLVYFKSIKNAYIYMYLVGVTIMEKFKREEYFIDQGFSQLLSSELFFNQEKQNQLLAKEILELAESNTIYLLKIDKPLAFQRFIGRLKNKSRISDEQDWFEYCIIVDKVAKSLKNKIIIESD